MEVAHIFLLIAWWLFFYHDDEIIMASSSLNKQLADRRRDRSMGVAHIFCLLHGDFFCHDDEIILASSLNIQTVSVPPLMLTRLTSVIHDE
jgi:hypothetical protein